MHEFDRFENQYIMMLALRAKRALEQLVKDDDISVVIDPNTPSYIEALHTIATKAKENMKEIDETTK